MERRGPGLQANMEYVDEFRKGLINNDQAYLETIMKKYNIGDVRAYPELMDLIICHYYKTGSMIIKLCHINELRDIYGFPFLIHGLVHGKNYKLFLDHFDIKAKDRHGYDLEYYLGVIYNININHGQT